MSRNIKPRSDPPGFIVHWKQADPYKCCVIAVYGKDVWGAMQLLDRKFPVSEEKLKAGRPRMSEFLFPALDSSGFGSEGHFYYNEKCRHGVMYFPTLEPPLPIFCHELYHAVRRIARIHNLMTEHDEPEAYLYEDLLSYFLEKREEDKKKGLLR